MNGSWLQNRCMYKTINLSDGWKISTNMATVHKFSYLQRGIFQSMAFIIPWNTTLKSLCIHYHQTSNKSHTLVGNGIVDHSHVAGASPAIADPATLLKFWIYFIVDLTIFYGLGKDNCKTRREIFKCWDLMRLVLKNWGKLWMHTS